MHRLFGCRKFHILVRRDACLARQVRRVLWGLVSISYKIHFNRISYSPLFASMKNKIKKGNLFVMKDGAAHDWDCKII